MCVSSFLQHTMQLKPLCNNEAGSIVLEPGKDSIQDENIVAHEA